MTNPIPGADSAPNPRAFIDMNGGYQSERTGVDKEAHDAWVKSTSWDLTRDDFIRLSYFHGDMESGSDGRGPINGSEDLPGDVVYVHPEKGALTRSMVSYWFSDSNSFMHGFKTARAAAKVGANVAADDRTILIETIRDLGEALLMARDMVGHPDNVAFINRAIALAGIRSPLAAGAPAETPKPVAVAVELIGVAEQIEQGAGFWHSCGGCHDTEDGHPTGNYAYSNAMRCALGSGCAECGGLGAMWDNNDYSEAAGDFLFAHPAPIAGDVEKDAARWRALLSSARIRMIGSAGLREPMPNNYAHFGMEIWTRYGSSLNDEQKQQMAEGNALGRDWLTKYADIAIEDQRAAMLANSSSGEAG